MRAHQHQVGEVGARNQQHERDSTQEHEQRRTRVANQVFLQRNDKRAPILVLIGVCKLETPGDRVHVCLRLRDGDARPQLGEAAIVVVAAYGTLLRRPRERQEHLPLLHERECGRRHANHRVLNAVQRDCLADYRRVTPEARSKERIGDDGRARPALAILLFGEAAANRRGHAKDRQEVGRRPQHEHRVRFAIAGQRHAPAAVDRDALE